MWARGEDDTSRLVGGDAAERYSCEATNLLLFGREQLAMSAMAWTLETHGYSVTTTGTVEEFLSEVEGGQPEICLVWEDLISDDVLAAIEEARRTSEAVVLVYTPSIDTERRARAVDAGAAACIDSGTSLQQLLRTMATARRRRNNSTSVALSQIPTRPTDRESGDAGRFLTPRELDSLRGLVHGESTSQIAARLGVRKATARTHIQNVIMKLGVGSRIAAVAYAVRHGVVQPETYGLQSMRRHDDTAAAS